MWKFVVKRKTNHTINTFKTGSIKLRWSRNCDRISVVEVFDYVYFWYVQL